ncbi:LTA synthase family protein [Leuconostoc carnosum]|uniref:LTA synthase family protein n=1 Tax=Leuconostoc carnosum TaxID=1252 RepID=UPI00272E05F9|nr:LTA synthase family protein [Leuconostoc carnosum]WLC58523.1 LTA synthase family protein [Leuconostoc carnosum]
MEIMKKRAKKSLNNFWDHILSPKNWLNQLNTRIGFFMWTIVFLTLKTILAYGADFQWLHVQDLFQIILMLVNPIGFTVMLFSLILFIKSKPIYYGALIILNGLMSLLLYLNVIYFREFSDFMSINTILGYKTVDQGGKAAGAIAFNIHDILFWVDIIILIVLLVLRKIKFDNQLLPRFKPFKIFTVGVFIFMANLLFSDIDRPQLLTRQFDREYMVKYLGLGPFTIFDAFNTYQTEQVRKSATPKELTQVKDYVPKHYAGINPEFYGKAKGKNVIVLHLESFQQMSIDRRINGQEVTPFLNSIYHDQGTIAFDNFFNQVGQGKTSDAENMLETSTFGLPQGSLFSKLGNDQTFQAMPGILQQRAGYSSAVFHGNQGTFWNRNNVYKHMGYQNWISSDYFDSTGKKATTWGLKDKLLFRDSVPYLELLQQPFYAKYLTVTNHTPFTLDRADLDPEFVTSDTGSALVDNYFVTNHYLDEAVKEFFTYLKKSGLYDNTMVVMYGDHYGIPNTDAKYLASVLGKDSDKWGDLDNANLQRVPFIVHIPGMKKGYIDHQFGGEIDVAPTIEHLLGISTKSYIQLGQDLLSKDRSNVVAFRNKDWITPTYASLSGRYWSVKTNEIIVKPSASLQKKFDDIQSSVNKKLAMSDNLNQKNLLRFYTPKKFKPIDADKFNYSKIATQNRLTKQNKSLGQDSKSLLAKNGNKSTLSQYVTDAPEANDETTDSTRLMPRNADDWSQSE